MTPDSPVSWEDFDRMIAEDSKTDASPFGDAVYSYSRAQAIEDGELVDVSGPAKEAGISFPVAMTRGVYAQCVELPEGYHGCQDVNGRLWDVVWMLRCAIRRSRGGDRIDYGVLVRRITKQLSDDRRPPVLHKLYALCGPGDTPAPVITIMLPEED